jgi:hypothetical protein
MDPASKQGKEPTDPQALRKQLQIAIMERDELQKDVETLCMQASGGGSMWDGSAFVLSERMYSAEAEVRKLKREAIDLADERDGLTDQVVEVGRPPAPAPAAPGAAAAAAAFDCPAVARPGERAGASRRSSGPPARGVELAAWACHGARAAPPLPPTCSSSPQCTCPAPSRCPSPPAPARPARR